MKRIVIVCVGLVLLGSSASAQTGPLQASQPPRETLNLTIEDAVRRATENNPDLAIARLNTQVEVERVSETLAAYAPVFTTVLGRTSNETPPTNFLLGEQGVATRDWFSSTGVRQRLVRGAGTWSVSWDASRTTSNSPLNSFQPSLQSGLRLALSQPLLKDRKMDSARQQNIIANRDQRSSELRFREAGVQTVAAVKQAYWTLKATLANVAVQQRSLELAHALVRENKARVDVGQTPPLDLLQAEAEVAQRRENLIRATTAAEDAEDRLRRFIMDPADMSFWRVRLNPTDQALGGAPLPDVDAVVEGALKERYDLARARIELDNVDTNVEFFNNQKLPDVRLETSYSGSGLAGTQLLRSGGFPGSVIGTRNKSFGDALGQAFGSSYPTWSLGVTVSYSLGRSFEEASLARSQVERRQVTQRIASLQLQAAEGIRQAARQVHSTLERVDAARAGATLAERRLDTEQRRFDVGLSTSFLVTQAQRDLLQAEVSLLQATLDHQSALVSFEAVQQAPANGDALVGRGAPTVLMPTPEPRGLFRQSSGAGF